MSGTQGCRCAADLINIGGTLRTVRETRSWRNIFTGATVIMIWRFLYCKLGLRMRKRGNFMRTNGSVLCKPSRAWTQTSISTLRTCTVSTPRFRQSGRTQSEYTTRETVSFAAHSASARSSASVWRQLLLASVCNDVWRQYVNTSDSSDVSLVPLYTCYGFFFRY